MKKTIWIFMFLLFLLLFTAGCGKGDSPGVSQPNPIPVRPVQTIDSAEFEAAGMCQYCHLEIYEQWQGSMHALAFTNPVYQAEARKTSRETDGAADAFCAACHAPIGFLAQEIPPADGSKLSEVARRGVSCDFCHTITEVSADGNGSYRVSPGHVKFGPFNDPLHTPLHESEYSTIYNEAEFCATCHEVTNPQTGLVLGATYSEWKASSFAPKRATCQDCHMTPGPGVTKPNPGYAATGAPKKREHTWTHSMVGGNVFNPEQAGFDGHALEAEQNLKAAATLFLGLPETLSPYQGANINVRVRNSGAGHSLPTGLTMFKEMWLEIVITDERGTVLYQNGVLDENGAVPDGSVVYKTTVANAAGIETTNLWEAASVIYDRRIPPQKYVDEFFEIPGAPLPGKITVQARLLYRSVSQENANLILGNGKAGVTVVEMAKITGEIMVR